MKKILLLCLILVTIFLIYLIFSDKKVYYVSIDNKFDNEKISYSNYVKDYLESSNKLETYINDFSSTDYRITDIISDINNNKKIIIDNKEKRIKNVLIKADLLTLNIGMSDITSKITKIDPVDLNKVYMYIDEIILDLDKLLNLIREYSKEDIFIIGVYYPYTEINSDLLELFSYYNKKFKECADKYQIKYIDVYDIFLENRGHKGTSDYYFQLDNQNELIYNQLIAMINNTILKNS